jgi:hypothetical protein
MGTFVFDPASGSNVTLSGGSPEVCIDLIEGFITIPQLRTRDWVVPRLDGEVAGNVRLGALILPAAGYIRGAGATATARREDWLANTEAVMAALDPSLGVGTLILAAGYLGLPTGSEATIPGRVLNAAPGKVQSYNTYPMQLWTFEFKCYDPAFEIGS